MTEETTLIDLQSCLNQIMRQKNISNYDIDTSGNAIKGDGYMGDITYIKVKATVGNKKKCFNLVVKSAKKNSFRETAPIRTMFEREIYMYTKIFPMMYDFQVEKKIQKPFNTFAKCHGVYLEDKKEALIFENIKILGYEVLDRKVPHDLNHAMLAFQAYAKFHAVSFALRLQKPTIFDRATSGMTDILSEIIYRANWVRTFKKSFKFAVDALKKCEPLESDIVKKFDGFDDEEVVKAATTLKDLTHRQSVVNHGDSWRSNLMFKYEQGDKSKPTGVMLIDFQISCLGSPVCDLTYYLYSCADEEIIENFDLLLETYYSTLSDHMRKLGANPDDIFTWNDLIEHWKEYGRFGLVMCPFVLKFLLCETDEVIDLADGVKDDSVFDITLKNHDELERRVRLIFKHFAERFM